MALTNQQTLHQYAICHRFHEHVHWTEISTQIEGMPPQTTSKHLIMLVERKPGC